MKTKHNLILSFERNAIAELDFNAMKSIMGGGDTNDGPTTFVCGDCVVVTRQLGQLNNL